MSLIDDIKRDREAGTPGKWNCDCDGGPTNEYAKATLGLWSEFLLDQAIQDDAEEPDDEKWLAGIWGDCNQEHHANASRIARVPDLEAALLAADELARQMDLLLGKMNPASIAYGMTADALAAYRKATGESK